MTTFTEGADLEQLRASGARLRELASQVSTVKGSIDSSIAALRSDWGGADLNRLGGQYEQTVAPALTAVASALTAMATTVADNVREQDVASDGSGGSSGGTGPGSSTGGSGGGGSPGSSTIPSINELRNIHLAGGGFDASNAAYQVGGPGYSVAVGSVHADGSYDVGIKDGTIVAAAGVSGSANLIAAHGQQALGPIGVQESATVGVEGTANGQVKAGLDGVSANAELNAFAGAKAGVDAGVEVGGVKGAAGVEAYAGIGAHGKADVELDASHIKLKLDIGIAVGVGVGGHAEIDINPGKIAADIGNALHLPKWF